MTYSHEVEHLSLIHIYLHHLFASFPHNIHDIELEQQSHNAEIRQYADNNPCLLYTSHLGS